MNRAFSPASVFLQLLLTAALALGTWQSASAADGAAATPPPVKPDAAKGETLYTNGDEGRNIAACLSCHGMAGNSTITQNPRLAGQHEAYLARELKNFHSGERKNPIMGPIASALTDAEIANLAAYLSAQTPKPGAARNQDTLELGKHIYRAGIAAKNVPACAGCHSPNGAGIPAQYPRLAGQHQDYTTAQLTAFRSGQRGNSAPMATIAERLSDKEIKAVADYIAGLK